jgi:hypothetical protein
MAKNLKKAENGYVVSKFVVMNFQKLEGKLLTIIETIGLEKKQEEAIKSLVRQSVWDYWNNAEQEVIPIGKFNEDVVGSGI